MNPPNVPGPSNLPPSGASGGMQMGGAPPPKSGGGLFTARNIIIGLVALGLLCICGCVLIFGVFGASIGTLFSQIAAPAAVGTEFMQAVQSGEWNKAYSLCTPSLQSELGSASALGKRITDGRAQPTSFTVSNTNLNNDRLEITGTANFTGGRTGNFELVITKSGNDWKVAGFNLQPR